KNKNSVSGGIFGASQKDRSFSRRIASLKSQGKNAMFDPDKYEPSMRAQAKAMARGTGRIISGKVSSVSCQQSNIKTLPGTCDIRAHAGTADVFNVISPSVRHQLIGQEI